MKKQLLALGTFLTSIAMLGCSGTPGNQVSLGPGQESNSVGADSKTTDSTGGLSTSNVAATSLDANVQTVRIGSIDWYVSYDDALAEAKKTNRPVWLHFGENPG